MAPSSRAILGSASAAQAYEFNALDQLASQAEFREMVDLAEAEDLIEDDEAQMIHSVFELGDTIAREVMVPRPDMVTIARDLTITAALDVAAKVLKQEGARVTDIELPPLAEPGRYTLKFDLVNEGVEWFEKCGSPTTTTPLDVSA